MWMLVLGMGCTRTPVTECADAEVTTGAVEDQLLPDGSTLESWLDRLTTGVEAPVRWDADGSSATVSVSVGSYEADAVSLTLGECAVPLLTVDACQILATLKDPSVLPWLRNVVQTHYNGYTREEAKKAIKAIEAAQKGAPPPGGSSGVAPKDRPPLHFPKKK